MFNEVHSSAKTSGIPLAFIKSLNVQAFPCGRRRSEQIEDPATKDIYHIPFDPEARLNTEANNRRHSGLNSFTQTYLANWDTDSKLLSLVLAGYLFNISLDTGYTTVDDFSSQLLARLAETDTENAETIRNAQSIYANIRIEEIPLFSGFEENYTTGILRDQSDTATPATSLDLLKSTGQPDATKTDNYYFAGLSFSTEPLTGDATLTRSIKTSYRDGKVYQQVISLRILEGEDGIWWIHEPARLPHIEHGDTENSVKLGAVTADRIVLTQTAGSVPSLNLVKLKDSTWQLQFSSVD